MQAAYSAWPVPPASNWVMKSWSNKTRLTNSALHSTLLRSSARLETQRVQHSGNQYSRNTSHVKQYIREGGPTSQQRSDSVSTPPTPQQELHSVPHTTNEPRKNQLPSCGTEQNALFCRRMVEQHQRPSKTSRPQRTRRLPERGYVV